MERKDSNDERDVFDEPCLSFLGRVAGWSALHLLPEQLRLGKLSNWYDGNGYYKFGQGQKIEPKNLMVSEREEGESWVVEGYTRDGMYVINVDGEIRARSKFNMEYDFRRAA